MTLISESLKRLLSGQVALKIWALAFFSYLISDLILLLGDTAPTMKFVLLIVLIVTLVGMIFAQWKVTRAISKAPENQPGSVGEWLGWTFLGFLICAAVPSTIVSQIWGVNVLDAPLISPLMLVVYAALASLLSPMLVHASGRAIDARGPS